MLKILFFGDVVAKPGRRALAAILPEYRRTYRPDLVVANVENLAHGKGVTATTLAELIVAGVDAFTSGNHVRHKEGDQLLADPTLPLIRPANFATDAPGRGFLTLPVAGTWVTIVNLIGRVFFRDEYRSPFAVIDELLSGFDLASTIIVDAHTEATSEIGALGWHLAGKVAAVIGTHTHVATADAKLLPNGTAFISDVGMVGPRDSVLGVEPAVAIAACADGVPVRHDVPDTGAQIVNAVLLTVDPTTKRALTIERVDQHIEL